MKKIYSSIILGAALALASVGVYSLQIVIFHSPRDTFYYFFQDMAFLPVQVAIVTLLLDRILTSREKREKLRKMNMVIGAFFIEAGSSLIRHMSMFREEFPDSCRLLEVNVKWSDKQFSDTARSIQKSKIDMDCSKSSLEGLKGFLVERKYFLLSLLENSNLLEHDTFSDMLWSVFHVADELESREVLSGLPKSDMEHLANDIKRAYSLLIIEWLYYMMHLKKEYPYLFSLAIRKSPFADNSSVIIGE